MRENLALVIQWLITGTVCLQLRIVLILALYVQAACKFN